MTKSEIKRKIESINYHHNRYIHNGACKLCEDILASKHFTEKLKTKVNVIFIELKNLKEPWGYFENRTSPDVEILTDISNRLKYIYKLLE